MDRSSATRLGEAAAGLGVVAVAALFVWFALGQTGATGSGRYELVARFPNATGVTTGSDVRMSGLRVGTVTAQDLDPQTFQAVLRLSIDERIRLPVDSAAAITSEGLLGGSYIALVPGGDPDTLAPGEEIVETQGAQDLMGLIGSIINRSGDASAP